MYLNDNYLNWFNIVGDDDQRSLFLFNESGDSVDSGAQQKWTLGWLVTLSLSSKVVLLFIKNIISSIRVKQILTLRCGFSP